MIYRYSRRFMGGMLAALCLTAGLTSASPAEASTQFRGGGFINEFSPVCASDGWSGIHMVTARYRPSGLPGNGTNTRLSVFTEWGAFNFSISGRLSGAFTAAESFGIFSSAWQLQNPPTSLRILPGSSTSLNASSSLITLIGEFANFGEIEGCSARFRFYMSRHN